MQTHDDTFSHNAFIDKLHYLTPYENFLFALKSKET